MIANHILAVSIDPHAITAASWFFPWLVGFFMGMWAKNKFF